ncbi:hypothetical protein CPLG_00032 [Cyanophage S-SSM2]|uniref:Uncharacterized protein n=2 Tax=Ahtivirus sagseatwo TaxID=2734079 RepID=A0A1D7SJB0_9CAUD|nr:hypothetical protein CPLG_00032 [Cyanophage S-SSM2]AOO13167.1 hypothetical protein LIS021110_053 [Cyanophage S-RIM14]AOO13383.1 hypothetical protein LIS110610_053 [Cyanophage S-RIM14]AOO13599.1 hypothetical protein Np111211_053 [Cyanophage S-RIM14]AOO13815.1 hypothetical protein Np450711_053 [Cyanophage S-RIM14]
MFLHDPILNTTQKTITRDALLLYIQDLQSSFYKDKTISALEYNQQMQSISDIVERLKLSHYDHPYSPVGKYTERDRTYS